MAPDGRRRTDGWKDGHGQTCIPPPSIGDKNRQTEEKVGRQYQRVDRNGLASSVKVAENRTRSKGIVARI